MLLNALQQCRALEQEELGRKSATLVQEKIGSGAAALRFAGEFIAGINRIQYNQGNGINALAGARQMPST